MLLVRLIYSKQKSSIAQLGTKQLVEPIKCL